jgi:hypothetical protein
MERSTADTAHGCGMNRSGLYSLRHALVGVAITVASCSWFDSHALPPGDGDEEADAANDGPADVDVDADADAPFDGDAAQDTDMDVSDLDVEEDLAPESVFTPLGLPPGGDFTGLAVVPNRTEILYALAAYQRIFRTNDGASTWTECAPYIPNVFTVAPAADPPGDVYIGSENGVLASHDGCASWVGTGLSLETRVLHILEDGHVLAGTEQGLRLYDGVSWSSLASTLEGYYVMDISASADGDTLFAGAWGNGMARSSDGGSSWESCNSGLMSLDVHHVAAAPSAPQRVYAYTEAGLERSTNGGDTWSRVQSDGGWALAVDPVDDDFVVIYQWNHLRASRDGGVTFGGGDRRSANMSMASVEDLLFGPSEEGLLYAATGRGVFRLDDMATWNWTETDVGLSAWSIWDLAAAPETGALYLATPTGVLRSMDGGASWSIEIEGFPTGLYTAASYTVAVDVDASDPDLVAAGGQFVMLSADGGSTFSVALDPGEEDYWWVETVEVSGARLYVGTPTRFHYSPDSGVSWFPHLIGGAQREVFDLLIYEESPPLVLAATDTGVFSTTDHGESFETLSDGLSSLEVYALARLAGGRLFAATPDGVFSAAAPGETWDRRSPAECGADDVMVHDGAVFAACSEGVYRSDDEGLTWSELPGLGGMWPFCMTVDGEGRLLVGTWGYGLHAAPLL